MGIPYTELMAKKQAMAPRQMNAPRGLMPEPSGGRPMSMSPPPNNGGRQYTPNPFQGQSPGGQMPPPPGPPQPMGGMPGGLPPGPVPNMGLQPPRNPGMLPRAGAQPPAPLTRSQIPQPVQGGQMQAQIAALRGAR